VIARDALCFRVAVLFDGREVPLRGLRTRAHVDKLLASGWALRVWRPTLRMP
jgi:hypothetical protein